MHLENLLLPYNILSALTDMPSPELVHYVKVWLYAENLSVQEVHKSEQCFSALASHEKGLDRFLNPDDMRNSGDGN